MIGVVGSGSWGTALAQVLADNHNDVIIWGRQASEIDDINLKHQNSKYFGDTLINENLKATLNFEDLKECSTILLAVPTGAVESVSLKLNEILVKPTIIINVAKGFHPTTHELLSEVIKRSVDPDKFAGVVSLIGPSHAEEVILRKLTTINAVSDSETLAVLIQNMFSNDYFRVYTNTDIIGSQIGVAIKNIISLASGIAAGLDLGDNARAALITRGLAEMTRYGVYFGGQKETFLGLCGVGDLIVTCTSPHSRNFQAGFEIGKANSAVNYLENLEKTVEGIFATKVVHDVASEEGILMPITEQVYKVVYEGKEPRKAIDDLMKRDLKPENL
ncbi:NAD(P)-dependent glycerol-3-phosphate dehydrogenase [Erysipelothrix inopinata]|uniref:Glycerol-3-phosphate dehydrogenase [NAD(P)+] n=1 Tax=Erysipelothrix inopinata TaxID=225084 RepID=A0A7G9RXU4_9FIRM|nr:NAD(P)H-dependent glycerol-3-phosphate dehydrogenase [Erysipelothrix inopinata]QNN60419.1 NAD(P)-dependent glycerol-3-phosphate dehydrogenase [Erysipelothrix inopinata]